MASMILAGSPAGKVEFAGIQNFAVFNLEPTVSSVAPYGESERSESRRWRDPRKFTLAEICGRCADIQAPCACPPPEGGFIYPQGPLTMSNQSIYFGYMKTIINVKTDKALKQQAKKVAGELGLSLSDVVNESLRQMVKNREVLFSAVPRMTPELEALLEKVEKDIKEGKNISPVFETAEEAIKYLHKKK